MASNAVLQQLLEDDSLERFLKENYGKVPYARPFSAKFFSGCLDMARLDELLKKGKSMVQLVRNNQLVDASRLRDADTAQQYLQDSHSLYLRHCERSLDWLSQIARDFESMFLRAVDIQAFLTPQGLTSFEWHYDFEEVFVIQVSGEKTFRLRQNTVNPLPSLESMAGDLHYDKERSQAFLNCTLKEGDWLYIPSGWWHRATAVTASTHLSIGVMPERVLPPLNI